MLTRQAITMTGSEKIKSIKKGKGNKKAFNDIFDIFDDVPKSLADHGVYYFNDQVDDLSTGEAITFILEANLNSECNWKYITMIVNSPGGYCSDGFALIDIMMGSRIPIRTVGIGMIASMGLQIFLTGQKGYRTLTPNCMILSHQYTGGSSGKEHELIASQKEFGILSEMVMRHYKRTTGLTEEEIRQYLLPAEDTWLTAKEAKKYGICDNVKDLKPLHIKSALINKKKTKKKK